MVEYLVWQARESRGAVAKGDDDRLIHGDVSERVHHATGPDDLDGNGAGITAQAKERFRCVLAHIAVGASNLAHLSGAVPVNPYDGVDSRAIAGGSDQLDLEPVRTADTGIGDIWSNGLMPGFCIELPEPPTEVTFTYSVGMPDDNYNHYLGEVLGTPKANYLRELWAEHYDSAWASGSSYTSQQNSMAEVFAAAVWEIVYEDLPVSPLGWDVTADGSPGIGGFAAVNLDSATANKWLHELTGGGSKADLLVVSHAGRQDYLVAVPEPATFILLGLSGSLGLCRRRRAATRHGRL